jgi:hypothetical protein
VSARDTPLAKPTFRTLAPPESKKPVILGITGLRESLRH